MWGINQYQQVPPAPRPTQFRGTWVMANSYQEAQGIPVPMDGTPILVMLNDEQKFYLVSMQNGQRMISAFSFNALTVPNNETAQNVPNNDLEARLSRIEEMIGDCSMNLITKMLQRQQPQNANRQSIIDMANGIRNGTVNAKDECLRFLHSMSREQKRQILPMFRSFAKRQGMSDNDINAFMQEVNV